MRNKLSVFFICLVTSLAVKAIPQWALPEIVYVTVDVGQKVSTSLKHFIKNPTPTMHFAKIWGPDFISVTPEGILNAFPEAKYTGENRLMVAILDRENWSTVKITLPVFPKTDPKPEKPLICESGVKANHIGTTSNGEMIYTCLKTAR